MEAFLFPPQIGLLGMVEATIEDLAFTTRSSRESDEGRRRCCIEHDFVKELEMRAGTGTEVRVEEIGIFVRSSSPPRRVVRNGVKNLHGSKPMPKSQHKIFSYHGNRNIDIGRPRIEKG